MSSAATQQNYGKKEQRVRGVNPAAAFFFVLVALVGGIVIGVYRHEIYASIAPAFGIKASSETMDTALLQQTYRELVANYDGELDRKALIEGASRGMTDAAGDQYTVFFDAKEAATFENEMSGSIGGGIGAQIGVRDDIATLVKIIAGTPAERADLQAGDRILEINDESTQGLTVDKVVDKIRGETGTTVKLVMERDGKKKDVSITREEITSPSVTKEIKGNVGVISVTRFDQKTARLAREAAQEFKEKKVKGVILDMRGNPGGYLTAARDISGLWLDRKVVVIEKEGDKVVDELRSGAHPILRNTPTVVLIDGASASASEIVAGALQDHNAATLIGEKSYGKGSVQRLIPLTGGSMLKVTVARWYTPNGKNITKEGITPDTTVSISEAQLREGNDTQLKAAIDHLK